MITYENFCSALVETAGTANLDVYCEKQYIETITCNKEYSFICVPKGDTPPHNVRAEIGFNWDSALTVDSIYGVPFPSPEDEQDPALTSRAVGMENDADDYCVELNVKYIYDLKTPERIPELVKKIGEIIRSCVNHKNVPDVKLEVSVQEDGKIKILRSCAEQVWNIDVSGDEVNFTEIFEEMFGILTALMESGIFPKSLTS